MASSGSSREASSSSGGSGASVAEAIAALARGAIIGGRYRVEELVGRSPMSAVVAAHDQQLDGLVAIKVLLPQRVANAEARARFSREARVASKIKGEHIARVTDVGAMDDGSPYMVMEHLEGETLETIVEREKRVPPAEAIAHVLQVCEVLREAHGLGIIHRGLRPAKLFLAKRPGRAPAIKVLDFGITSVGEQAPSEERMTALIRAHGYMAPELLKSAMTVDVRTDIWAVGVILFELIVGEPPFQATSIAEMVAKILNDMPNLRGAPQPLQAIFRRCFAKAARERYASIDHFAEALRACASSGAPLDVEVRRATPPPSRAVPTQPSPQTLAAVTPRISLPPDTVQDDALDVSDDEAELVDSDPQRERISDANVDDVVTDDDEADDDTDDDGETVDEAELIRSDPPPASALPELPKAPPRTIVWLEDGTNASAKSSPALALAPAPAPAPATDTERTRTTDKPPRTAPDPPSPPPPADAASDSHARRKWLALAVIAIVVPAAVFFVGRSVQKDRAMQPDPSPASSSAPPAAALIDPPAPSSVTPSETTPPPPPPPSPPPPPPPPPPLSPSPSPPPSPSPSPPPPVVATVTPPTAPATPARPITAARPVTPATPVEKPEDDATVALNVAMRNHARLRAACWDTSGKTTHIVSVVATVDRGGAVTSANATSADPALASCVAAQVRTWSFPSSPAARTLQIPVRFRR